MSKILKLREWLTVEEAARRLSISTREEVSVADMLRLALDGHLTLSVHFVNHARGRPIKIKPLNSEASDSKINEHVQDFLRDNPQFQSSAEGLTEFHNFVRLYRGDLLPDGESVLIYEGDGQHPITLEGVWDLLMLGAETLDVEHAYQLLTDGVPVELVCLGGPLVASPDRSQYFQLLDSYKRDVPPSKKAVTGNPPLSKEGREAINRVNQILGASSDKTKQPEHEFDWDYETVWYPAAGLPNGHTLVVRSLALRDLELKLLEPETEHEKPMHPTERRSVAQLMAALAAASGIDLSTPYAADETLRAVAATHGIELPSSPETVVKYLKLAAPYLPKR